MGEEKKRDPAQTASVLSELEYMAHSQIRDAFQSLDIKYKRFFDASRDMRFVMDHRGMLMDVNEAGAAMFGFAGREEMLQIDSMDQFFQNQDDRRAFQQKIENEGFVKDYEVEMRKKDGSRIIANITANLWFESNGSISYKGLLQDVTERRQWQTALMELEQHNRQLTESEEHLKFLNQHILHMLMIMSHDVRGPLVAMGSTLKLLIRGLYGSMDDSVLNTVKDLLTRTVQLIGIVEDCLGMAHSVEGTFKVERETLDLRQDIIDPVLDELFNDIQQRQILIDNRLGAIPAGAIPIHVNKIWLKAVFRNLFKNAIKYGGKCCTVAFGFEDLGSCYRLNVYNSGDPIPEEQRHRLFTKFGRIESAQKNGPEGIGMGLYLIKEIIQKHGGSIWYEAKPNGSDFVFTIPKG